MQIYPHRQRKTTETTEKVKTKCMYKKWDRNQRVMTEQRQTEKNKKNLLTYIRKEKYPL